VNVGKPPINYISYAEARARMRLLALVLFPLGMALAYWLWPDGITDRTLGSITLGELLEAGAAAFLAIVVPIFSVFLCIGGN
jgi:hypothetical protein